MVVAAPKLDGHRVLFRLTCYGFYVMHPFFQVSQTQPGPIGQIMTGHAEYMEEQNRYVVINLHEIYNPFNLNTPYTTVTHWEAMEIMQHDFFESFINSLGITINTFVPISFRCERMFSAVVRVVASTLDTATGGKGGIGGGQSLARRLWNRCDGLLLMTPTMVVKCKPGHEKIDLVISINSFRRFIKKVTLLKNHLMFQHDVSLSQTEYRNWDIRIPQHIFDIQPPPSVPPPRLRPPPAWLTTSHSSEYPTAAAFQKPPSSSSPLYIESTKTILLAARVILEFSVVQERKTLICTRVRTDKLQPNAYIPPPPAAPRTPSPSPSPRTPSPQPSDWTPSDTPPQTPPPPPSPPRGGTEGC